MKGRSIFLIFLLLLSIPASAEDLMNIIGEDFHIFSEDRPLFIKPSNARFFRWISDEKNINVAEMQSLYLRQKINL